MNTNLNMSTMKGVNLQGFKECVMFGFLSLLKKLSFPWKAVGLTTNLIIEVSIFFFFHNHLVYIMLANSEKYQ